MFASLCFSTKEEKQMSYYFKKYYCEPLKWIMQILYYERVLNFVKFFFRIRWGDMIFIFHFINIMYHIY